MAENRANLENAVAWQALLGYLNFSEGRPDPRFQGQLNDAYRMAAAEGGEPVPLLAEQLHARLAELRGGGGAFQDARQVEAVLGLVFDRLLPAYRQHHADLLAHQSDRNLFGPFFLARAFEAVLAQGTPWAEEKRIVQGALHQLNDYVGHRPVAVLEGRRRGEPYDRERVRPVPLYLRGAGVAAGRYHDLVRRALEILAAADPVLRADAYFDLDLLDELALDPRAYDHNHPVNRRPNYVFGEWDPHHMDNQGRFRRFIVRQLILDALLERVEQPGGLDPHELSHEAACVLAGIMLMASGVSGNSASAHDSSVTLKDLHDRIPRYRDAFYTQWIQSTTGAHGERLRQEMAQLRQPFGQVRQHLNQFLGRHRASQQQQRHLALLFAEMGQADASRQQAALIATPSLRMLGEILIRLTQAQMQAERGELAAGAALLPQAEELLRRGIRCGAFADPWNILGFQGLYPLFQSREDSIRDSRVDELIDVVDRLLGAHSHLLGEAAAAGDQALSQNLARGMRRLAQWWDQFASTTVGDVRRVHGGEATDAAEHVAVALARWHEQGEATAGPTFWKQHLSSFQSPKAFALVLDALLRKHDYRASMSLLIHWLGHAEQVPLEDGDFSFHALALRWLLAVTGARREERETQGETGPSRLSLVKKFFDYLEVNAEENWDVPRLETDASEPSEEAEENPYGAAYEDVTYEDSTAGREGAVIDDGPAGPDFVLEEEGKRLEKRLRFLSTVARLWEIAARQVATMNGAVKSPAAEEAVAAWLARARANRQQLLALLNALHESPVPEPLGSHESLIEFDRRRLLKEQLLEASIGTCLDTTLAVHALASAAGDMLDAGPESGRSIPEWQPLAIQLEQAMLRGDAGQVRHALPEFVKRFCSEPLLFVPLSAGGHPAAILRARFAQAVLQTLVEHLPYLGLLRETHYLLQAARLMEETNPAKGRRVTEFDRLFQLGFQGAIETVVASARHWDAPDADDRYFVQMLELLTGPFLRLWMDHSRTLQLSSLEKVAGADAWQELRGFIQTYGRELFGARFMVLANLRGVLHRGTGEYLRYLRDHAEADRPTRLLADLDRVLPEARAAKLLKRAIRAVAENYEEYKDYKTTTPQSDYGENLHALLDFLRVKASYDRHAWQFRPLVLAHEVLARQGCATGALLWQEAFTHLTRDLAEQHLGELTRLEQTHGFRLRTLTDHLEQRFVKPLAIDRLCVLVAPAMAEARTGGDGSALARFQQELAIHAATPAGVGLDVPHWLRRLEREVQRVRAEHTALSGLTRKHFSVPRTTLSLADIQQQLTDWDKPLE